MPILIELKRQMSEERGLPAFLEAVVVNSWGKGHSALMSSWM